MVKLNDIQFPKCRQCEIELQFVSMQIVNSELLKVFLQCSNCKSCYDQFVNYATKLVVLQKIN
jgi:uncharacterized protein with PIN domain